MTSKNNLSWNQKKRKHLYLEKHSAGFHYTRSLYLLQRLAKRQKLIGLCTRSKEASVGLINTSFLLGCMSASDQSCSKLLGVRLVDYHPRAFFIMFFFQCFSLVSSCLSLLKWKGKEVRQNKGKNVTCFNLQQFYYIGRQIIISLQFLSLETFFSKPV